MEVAKIFERKTGMKLKSGWGMTETCSPGTGHPPEGPDKPGSIGLMLPGIEMDVVALDDPDDAAAGRRSRRNPHSRPERHQGLLEPAEGNAAAFVGDRFLTGDIGYMDSDGYFYLVDRKTDMIISGGFNVYPQMIEQAIYTHPAVQEVIVIGIPDDYRGEAAKAFIKLRAGAEPFTLEELRAFLTGKLGKHELPAAVDFVDELPRTPVGKLSRHELRSSNSQRNNKPHQEVVLIGRRPGLVPGPIRRGPGLGQMGRRSLQHRRRWLWVPAQGRDDEKLRNYSLTRRIRWISLSARKKSRFVRR